ncbi:MAG: chorismate mutase/prephenate dehydratase [Alteromonadaceae bacterium]|jgi:chorismate mutase/prephenate dehydratase
MNLLEKLRVDINEIDSELLILLAKRRRISNLVGENKIKSKKPIRDSAREEELLVRLISYGRSLGLDTHYINQLYRVIIEDSVLNQQALLQSRLNEIADEQGCRVAFLGGQGSYSYLACLKYFSRRSSKIIEIGCSSFNQITSKVETGEADYAMLPIENTSSGSINEVYDLLQHTSLSIVGELTQPVNHCLVGIEEIDVDQITVIYTHPQPHAQCSLFIDELKDVKIEYCDSTSQAFERVRDLNSPTSVAIGSAEGGKAYALVAIKEGLANQKQNFSRFIVVSRKPVQVAQQIPAKTTIIMSTDQQAGSLVDALICLKNHNLNMSKLESRPITGNPWQEMFYLDLQGNINDKNMQQALSELEQITRFVKVLGSYPSEDVVPVAASI